MGLTGVEMRRIWEKHDILNSICVVENSLYLFNEGEREILLRAFSNIKSAVFCAERRGRSAGAMFFDYFRTELERDENILSLCLKEEGDLNRQFILGFMLEGITKALKYMCETDLKIKEFDLTHLKTISKPKP